MIHCIAAHHNDVEPQTVEAVLVQAADAISAARPGARRESIENYITPSGKAGGDCQQLPGRGKVVTRFSPAARCASWSSRRISPTRARYVLAREIAKRIENELEYPGQIKVNVIRETRCTEFAK